MGAKLDLFADVIRTGTVLGLDANLGSDVATADEALEGATFSLTDPKTGAIVATATSDASGRAYFRDIPAGRYLVVAERFRVLSDWHVIASVCSPQCNNGWTVQVV